MGVAKQLDEACLDRFFPLNTLSPPLLKEAMAHGRIERHPPGRTVFRSDDPGSHELFLLAGQLALVADGQPVRTLRADSREAARSLAEACPLHCTVLARTSVTLLRLDRERLESLLRRNEACAPSAVVPGASTDTLLQTALTAPIFSRLPRLHLQALKQRLDILEVKKGQTIIREGEPGTHYHLILSGRCQISRRRRHKRKAAVIAELGPGEGFGEGALIAHDCHDSTVSMLEGGQLLRISKGDFLTLLVRPFIKWIPYQRLLAMKAEGAVLLDIRSAGVFRRRSLPGSINIPLATLRQCAPLLDKRRRYIICSDIGRRASTAAFLLARQGMDVRVLDESMRTSLQKNTGRQQ
ncbi:MAG TPA: cyclic nucleotide-binding domain-containing protein [Gammaproteobacteria bacterium]|nr:cyclic nucleotide-binding domain-containing protein [Gammaproteobacteria bacterium]